MKVRLMIALCALCVLLAGCNKSEEKTMAPMGNAAPAFGSAGKADMQSFMVGDWCYVDPDGIPKPGRTYTFTADGKFKCGGANGEWDSTGSWKVQGNMAFLTYETMKGKSFEEYRAEYKKDEEGGGQVAVRRALFYDGLYDELGRMTSVWVDQDQKHLSFTDPSQKPAAGDGGDSGLGGLTELMQDKRGLERMELSSKE